VALLACVLCCLVQSSAYVVSPLAAQRRPQSAVLPLGGDRLTVMALGMPSGDEDDDSETEVPWDRAMSTLAERMVSVKASESLQARFHALPSAWVLVFDADTDDEAVYSMEVEAAEEESHVVLAFESKEDAEEYSVSLQEDAYSTPASAQQLDFEALVVTSRDANFGVAVVFEGDLRSIESTSQPIFDGSGKASTLSVSITMVPEELYADVQASDYIDPAEDPIWVLVQDAGTADAQYFSMVLNGSDSIVCFRDEASASRCSAALTTTGAVRSPLTEEVLLEDLLSNPYEERDVCLVDEVVEMLLENEDEPSLVAADEDDVTLASIGGAAPEGKSSATPQRVLKMLDRLFHGVNASDSDSVE